jgi:hypothetical protein
VRNKGLSLSARAAASTALHVIRSGHDHQTIYQLEKYVGECAYEQELLQLIEDCSVKCNLLSGDAPPGSFEIPAEELLK